MLSLKNKCLFIAILFLVACREQSTVLMDDLSALKNEFMAKVLQGSIEECPFSLSYKLRTIFYSRELISLFGEFHQYTHLPHGWTKYEGRTFYKKNGKFLPLFLDDLLSGKEGWEFVRAYCENVLKNDPCSYFSGEQPLRTVLELKDLNTFILDDQALIFVFQPYTVAGGTDGPPIVKIRWDELERIIKPSHFLSVVLNKAITSKCFISSWDENSLEQSLGAFIAPVSSEN